MASGENINNLQVSIEKSKIVFIRNSYGGDAEFDTANDDVNPRNIRIELEIAKVFHKVLNLIKTDPDLFQREDFELLGEMLSKIIFGKGNRDFRQAFMTEVVQSVKVPNTDRSCRFYLEFYDHSDMANLPWEYVMYRPRDPQFAVDKFYLSASKKSRFHLIRRFSPVALDDRLVKQPTPHADQEKIYVIVLMSLDGNGNTDPKIDDRNSDARHVKTMFADLNNLPLHQNKMEVEYIDHPSQSTLTQEIEAIVNKWKAKLGDEPAYVVHYFGHSFLHNQIGKLVIKPTPQQDVEWIQDADFADFFNRNRLKVNPPVAIVFQSCDSAKIGYAAHALHGVCYELTRLAIPAIVGMQNEISTIASCAFFRHFYESLLDGHDIAEAVTNGRDFLGTSHGNPRQAYVNNLFGSPVLFITTNEPIRLMVPEQKPKAPAIQATNVYTGQGSGFTRSASNSAVSGIERRSVSSFIAEDISSKIASQDDVADKKTDSPTTQ